MICPNEPHAKCQYPHGCNCHTDDAGFARPAIDQYSAPPRGITFGMARPGPHLHAIMEAEGMTLAQQKDALEQALLIVTRLQRQEAHSRPVDWAEEAPKKLIDRVDAARGMGA